MPNSRAFVEARSHLPAQEEIDAALSARYTQRHHRRAAEQAANAGFDAVPEPVSRETPVVAEPEKPLPHPSLDYPVVRLSHGDLPSWGQWLIGQIQENWPTLHRFNLASILPTWMGSNDHLFIRTSNSASLAISVPHPFIGGETIVRGIFCWTRFPQEEMAELHLVQLHRFTIDWSRARRARFELFEKSDLVPSRADFFIRPKRVALRYVDPR